MQKSLPNKRQIQKEQDDAFYLIKQNKITEAKIVYQNIILNDPKNDSAHHMLAFCYSLLGEYEKALDHVTEAIKLYKCCADYYNTAGAILRDLGHAQEALKVIKEGLKVKNDHPETYSNLGLIFSELGQTENSKKCFEASISIEPNAAFVHFNYALTLLKSGDYKKGWQEYEWRHQLSNSKPEIPKLEEIKTAILHHEQGFGDNIQFVRYAKLLKEQGVRVNAIVSKPLERLFKTSPYLNQVNEEVMDGDCLIPMMSLPFIFNTELDSIPTDNPFVIPESKLEGFNIGIAWTSKKTPNSNVHQDNERILPSLASLAYKSAQLRHVEPKYFSEINKIAKLWSLQPNTQEFKQTKIEDFYDLALLIQKMDLVISIDTAAAHLAATLGKPTWLLLPYCGEWRWLENRNDSPWYPTIKIYRQPQKNDWDSVFKQLLEDLTCYVAKSAKN